MPKESPYKADWHHLNALYLLAAICMIFMTFAIAIQPLFLRSILGINLEGAGTVNASVQVLTEIIDLLLIGYLGYLSDRFGRIPLIVYGFILAAIASIIAPYSIQVGAVIGLSGLTIYFVSRILMSIGTAAVWPQLAALTGDFSAQKNRARLTANTAFMMAFGGTLVYAVLMQIPQHSGIQVSMLLIVLIALSGAFIAKHYLVDVAEKLEEKKVPWRSVVDLLKKDERLRLCYLSAFASRNDMVLIGLFLMLWFIYFSDIVNIPYEVAATRAGMLIGMIGFITLITIPLWGKFIEKYGRLPAIILGLSLSGTGFIGLMFITNPFKYAIIIPAALIAMGQAGMIIAPQILTIDIAPENLRGSVLGGFNTVGTLGIIIFVQLGGISFDYIGPYAPFLITGIMDFIIVLYSLKILVKFSNIDGSEISVQRTELEQAP